MCAFLKCLLFFWCVLLVVCLVKFGWRNYYKIPSGLSRFYFIEKCIIFIWGLLKMRPRCALFRFFLVAFCKVSGGCEHEYHIEE